MKLEELANISVGGNFLRYSNGFKFLFNIVDFEPEEVIKPAYKPTEKKKTQRKFQWRVLLKAIKIGNPIVMDYLNEVDPAKTKSIQEQEINNAYLLELPPGASKQLAQYCIDEKIKISDTIEMLRTGDKQTTKYAFIKSIPEELEEPERPEGF
ncbi:hypothetical protein LCGC14_2649790 [marine sediment metagenome]|uniref:Uncharacterized protein n=1 Tax=marine sediment metagenome TaxID=412755 RepID=A0A0F9CM51_9ZZZZ